MPGAFSEAVLDDTVKGAPEYAVKVELKIWRYDASTGERALKPYEVDVSEEATLLDTLDVVKDKVDGTLSYRKSCRMMICGSCGMRVDGGAVLACKTRITDIVDDGHVPVISAMGNLPILKDLVVDMDPFFQAYRDVMPFLITKDTNEPTRERLQTAEDRERFDDTTKCILCAACTSSCPVFWNDGQYFGPAAIVNAHRFIFDSRDEAAEQRLEILNDRDGVWRCRTTFNCTDACPRGIDNLAADDFRVVRFFEQELHQLLRDDLLDHRPHFG